MNLRIILALSACLALGTLMAMLLRPEGHAATATRPEGAADETRDPARLESLLEQTDSPRSLAQGPQVDADGGRPADEQVPVELTLLVRDQESGDALECTVYLWRLGLPEDEDWTAGDRFQALVDSKENGEVLEHDLPPGLYRALCSERSTTSDDSPAFELTRGPNEVTLWIERPSKHSSHLELYTHTGVLVEEAKAQRFPSTSWHSVFALTPSWAKLREPHDPDDPDLPLEDHMGFGGGGFGSTTDASWKPLKAGPLGLKLGTHAEDPIGLKRAWTYTVKTEGSTEVRCSVKGAHLGERVYTGVVLPRDLLLRRLLLPGGGDARDLSKWSVRIRSKATLREPSSHEDLWRYLPIHLKVNDDDYEPLELEFTLSEGLPPEQVLQLRTEEPPGC